MVPLSIDYNTHMHTQSTLKSNLVCLSRLGLGVGGEVDVGVSGVSMSNVFHNT